MSWTKIRSQIAVEHHRKGGPDPVRLQVLQRDLRAARLEAHIQEALDKAPPLSGEQIDRLVSVLRGTRGQDPAA